MKILDIDISEVKKKIEHIYGKNFSNKTIGFNYPKIDGWASVSYTHNVYKGCPNNDDISKPENERVHELMVTNKLNYRDVLGFDIEIEQGDRILDRFPEGGVIRFDMDSKHIGFEAFNNNMHSCYWYAYNIDEYEASLDYIISIIKANKKYLESTLSKLNETRKTFDEIPKSLRRKTSLKKLLNVK